LSGWWPPTGTDLHSYARVAHEEHAIPAEREQPFVVGIERQPGELLAILQRPSASGFVRR